MDRPGVRQVPEGGGEQGKMEKTGCEIICGAPTTLAVKGLMIMMMYSITQDTQDTTHLIQRPCYQRGSTCQDPAGNWTTRRPDGRKETQTAVVWTCIPFIRSGQNHLARYNERGKKTRQTEEEVGRQYQAMDRPGVRQVLEGSGEQGKMEETGCEIICGAQTTLAVKG